MVEDFTTATAVEAAYGYSYNITCKLSSKQRAEFWGKLLKRVEVEFDDVLKQQGV
jgi:hypothetical protein